MMKLRTRLFAMVLSVLMIVTSANVMIMAVNEPTITVSSVQGKTGDVVEVTVTLDNNPGIVSMSLNVEYDQTALHLIGVKDSGLMPGEMHTDAYSKMPYPLTWENDTSRVNFDVNGVVVTLSFEIIAKTAGDYDINISVPRDGIYNVDTDNIDFNIVNGNVSVSGSHTHSMNHTAAVTATCRATGNVEYWYCSSCEKYFADENGSTELSTISVDKNAENHVGGTELRNVKVATATEEGYTGDTYCLGCGVKIADGKTVPIVAETESIKITVSKDSVLPGEEAIVYVNVEENPGVNYMQLSLNYDDEHLTLSNVVYGSEFGDALVSEKNYSWSKSVGDFEGTGLLMELHFTVAEDEIESVYPVTIEKGRMGINDWNEQNIALVSIDGSVEVILGIAGDINKDKSVNGKDNTRLLRYMNGDNVIVDDRALDTNGDSNVNGKDTTRLLRVLNGDKLALYYNGTAFYPNGTSNTLSRSARVMSIQRDATPVIAISIDDASAIPGGGFSVTAMVTSNPGVNYMQLTLNYDDTYLTLSNVTYGSTFGEALNTGKNYTWSKNVGNMEGTGELVTMTFQVSEDAPIGVYSDAVTLTEGANGINDWDENSIKLSTDGCTLSVVCNHSMTYNVAKTATCIEAGNVAHYYCSKCKICFENEEGTNKIDNVVLAIDAKKHTELIANAAVEATCKETGNVEYWHCSGCEKNFSDEAGTVVIESVSVPVNKDNHTGEKEVRNAVEATCGDDGYTGDTYCKNCGEKITDGTVVPATEDHTGGEATCKLEAICDVCGNSYGSTEASNHKGDTEVRNAVEATCGDDGYTGDTYCNDCGEKISDGNVISATGEHSDTDEDKLCDVCGADLSCKHTGEKEVRNAVEATCGDDGYTGDTYCKSCGEKITDGTFVPATENHIGGEATCKLEAICDVCGNSYGSTEASNHKGDTEVRDAVEATCGDDGYTGDTYCNDCGEKISDGNVISATGEHSDTDEDKLCDVCGADLSCKHMGEKEVRNAVEATCVKEGYTGDVYCKNCGKKIRDGMIVEATGIHTPGNWIIDEEATSEEVGLKHKECVLCGLVLEIREISVVESGFDFNDWYFSMAQLMNRKFTVSAGAGEGGSISNEGITKVKYNNSITYYITPADGYDIDAVYVNGRKIGVVNEYTFKNVSSNQSISVTFVRTAWDNPFIDISDDAEYIEAIEFVYENELFKGISKTEFAPEMTMTRAMFVTVLGRLAGVDADMYTETSFDDVVSGEWYAPYVEWAASEGIVNGYGNGTFGVNDEITIEQAVVILTRYAEYTGAYCECDVLLEKYADSDEVCYWAVEAMKWAVGNGIYTCRAGEIAPQRSADRALIANMIYNYVTIFHK